MNMKRPVPVILPRSYIYPWGLHLWNRLACKLHPGVAPPQATRNATDPGWKRNRVPRYPFFFPYIFALESFI